MSKTSIYEKGRTCICCGKHLDSSDSYSARPPHYKPICNDCDVDLHVPQKENEE